MRVFLCLLLVLWNMWTMGVVQELLQVCTGKHRPFFVGKEGGDKTHLAVKLNESTFPLFLRDLCGFQNIIFTDTLGWWVSQISQWALKICPSKWPICAFSLCTLQSVRQAKSKFVVSFLSYTSQRCMGVRRKTCYTGASEDLELELAYFCSWANNQCLPGPLKCLTRSSMLPIWWHLSKSGSCHLTILHTLLQMFDNCFFAGGDFFFFLSKRNSIVFVNDWTGLCNAQKEVGVRQPYVGGEGQAFPSSQFLRKGNGEKKKNSTDCKVLLFLIRAALGVDHYFSWKRREKSGSKLILRHGLSSGYPLKSNCIWTWR